jgi:hypothetical protein
MKIRPEGEVFSAAEIQDELEAGYQEWISQGGYLKSSTIGDGLRLAFMSGAAWASTWISSQATKSTEKD